MKKYKRKKVLKGLLIGGGLTILTLYVAFTVFMWLVVTGGPAKKVTDISRYQEIFEWSTWSAFIVFPEEISKEALETEFYAYYRDTMFAPTYQIYYQCNYKEEAFKKEIERLENTRKVYGKTERKLLRDETNKFNYSAYIAVENHSGQYEYALVTGENQITYIATSDIDKDDVVFDKTYLPIDFMTETGSGFGSGHNIYMKSQSSMGISYDHTRNEFVEVTDVHIEQVLDSLFIVRTKLDENNREIITECAFDYYESLEDEECNSTIYSDINGMEYRNLRLNEDRTQGIVVYYNGREEKEFVVELPLGGE